MIKLHLPEKKDRGFELLCIGAHCDDIEIGCGGAILTLLGQYKIDKITWVVFCSNEIRKKEAEKSATRFLKKAGVKKVKILNYRDGFLPDSWGRVKEEFELLKDEVNPDLIFTHNRDDLHQDHRTVNELTWNTFRNHMILEYEIPKYDGDLTTPSLYIHIHRKEAEQKKKIILECFESQKSRHWLDEELLGSLMRIRGVESVSESGYAEGFHVRKVLM